MTTSNDALAEVYFVLSNLNKEEYDKIPIEIIKAIKENMNIDYRFNIDINLDLTEQAFLPETRAILFNLFRDYLATPKQKDKIYKIQNSEKEKLYQRQKYDVDLIFKNNKNKYQSQNVKIVEYRKNIFQKIFEKIINWINNK